MNLREDEQQPTAAGTAQPILVREASAPAAPSGIAMTVSRPTFLDDATKEPWRFDFFTMMRRLERTFPDQPRIGDSASLREEFVLLGQDPFMDFPASNLSKVERTEREQIRVYAKF